MSLSLQKQTEIKDAALTAFRKARKNGARVLCCGTDIKRGRNGKVCLDHIINNGNVKVCLLAALSLGEKIDVDFWDGQYFHSVPAQRLGITPSEAREMESGFMCSVKETPFQKLGAEIREITEKTKLYR